MHSAKAAKAKVERSFGTRAELEERRAQHMEAARAAWGAVQVTVGNLGGGIGGVGGVDGVGRMGRTGEVREVRGADGSKV